MMINPKETMYHLETHKQKYFIFCIQLTLLLFGVMLIGIANHEQNERSHIDYTMESFGILFLMGSILWFSIYLINLIWCPDKDICHNNICCNENDHEIW